MYIIKVRDRTTATTRATMPERVFRLIDWDTWKPCLFRYDTLEKALALCDRQQATPTRYGEIRDYRVFEKDGRKLKLVYEYIAGEEEE